MSRRNSENIQSAVVVAITLRDSAESEICPWCERRMIFGVLARRNNNPLCISIEHIIPLGSGGTWNIDNLVLACFDCNQRRGAWGRQMPESPWPVL